jgi:NADPH:quinone reductase-like Zn-dependent oxidoreductase
VAKTYRGTYAEYVVVPEKSLAAKPKKLRYKEAAAVPLAALTAWQAMVNQGRLKPGQCVLIHAGAGGVGVMAIQIAKTFGAYVAATASTRNQDLLRELGADLAIDYTREEISKLRPKFDLALDGVGESVWAESFRVLKVGGRLLTLTPPIPEQSTGRLRFFATSMRGMAVGVARGLLGGKRLAMTRVKPRGGELEKISALIEAGKIRPIVEKVFALEQIAEAHRLSEAGHVRGKLVISIRG